MKQKPTSKKDTWTSDRQGIWKIRTNQELRELYKDLGVVKVKLTLEQATKNQRGSRSIAVLLL
jgi:hypothetical protein